MGLFEKIFGKQVNPQSNGYWKLMTAYTPVFTTFDGEIYESELVRASIDAKARHISKLGVELKGSANSKLQNQLKKAPNSWQTWSQLLYRISTILDVTNNVFIVPVLNMRNEAVGITTIYAPHYELIDVGGEAWIRFEFLNGDRSAIELNRVGILTRYQLKNDYFGEDNSALNSTMQLIQVQNDTITESAKNASSYSFTANLSNFATDEDLKKERERFTEQNLKSGSGILLFPNKYQNVQQVKTTTFSLDANQMETIEKNVYNYFGTNKDILQNSAIGDKLDAFFNGAIEPFAIQLTEVLTKMLFSDREIAQGSGFIVNANRLQYMTVSEKVSFASMAQQMGMMTIDEYRELFNLAPFGDERGEHIVARGEYYDTTTGEKIGKSEGDEDEKSTGQTE